VELLIATPFVRKLIEENNLEELENAMKQGGYYGMQTFNQVVLKYYQEEKITLEVALEGASNPEELLLSIRGIEEDRGIKFE
jgi:Tfp pilus assembly pilus retraction ATPase PilT